MSVELLVFVHERAMPTSEEWQREISDRSHRLLLETFDTRTQTGFVPGQFDGEDCGFEYWFSSIDPQDVELFSEAIGDRTHVVTFVWHRDELDAKAATIAASVLAAMANGVFHDPQCGSFATGSEVFDLLRVEQQDQRLGMMLAAEQRWAHVTNRRCPECNALCPEYRRSCWVCKHELGRVKD